LTWLPQKQFVNEGAYVFITGQRDAELAAAGKKSGKNVTRVQGDVANLGGWSDKEPSESRQQSLIRPA